MFMVIILRVLKQSDSAQTLSHSCDTEIIQFYSQKRACRTLPTANESIISVSIYSTVSVKKASRHTCCIQAIFIIIPAKGSSVQLLLDHLLSFIPPLKPSSCVILRISRVYLSE